MDSVDEAMRKLHNNKIEGFTIFELLIVVALVGILSTIAIASHSQALGSGAPTCSCP